MTRKFFLLVAWVVQHGSTITLASLDPSKPKYDSLSFTYSQDLELDVFSASEEMESNKEQMVQQAKAEQLPSSSSLMQSKIEYHSSVCGDFDAGGEKCFVSTKTIIETSAEDNEDSLSRSMTGDKSGAFSCVFNIEDNLENEDEDNDDDDDDNDGHSSMLSNSSLRRTRTFIASVTEPTNDTAQGDHLSQVSLKRRRRNLSAYHGKRDSSMTSISSSLGSVLSVRGGATRRLDFQSLVSSELSKKLVVTAIVTLLFEGFIGHILEFVKIVMQTSDSTYIQAIQNITFEKGIIGLWDGFCPWGIIQAVTKGAVFGLAYAAAAGFLVPLADQGILPMALALTLAGGIGGGFQGYVLSPTLLLKTRVMTNPVFRENMSMLKTTILSFRIGADIVNTEGLVTLMKGSNVFATKRVFDWATRYFFADLFESIFLKLNHRHNLTVFEKSIASLLGGAASTLLTLPLDVLVAKTQDAKKAGVKVSALRLFIDELQQKGINGLRTAYMRGFEVRLLHVCLTTLVIKTGTPIAYEAIFGSSKA